MSKLLLLTLFFSSWALGQDFDTKLKSLEEEREEVLFKWRTANKFTNKLPNDEYVKVYNDAWTKYLERELKLYQESCKTNKSHCLTVAQTNLRKSQINIVTGLMTKKNEWSRQGLSAEEQRKKEEEFKNQAIKDNGRDIAGERSGREVKPEIKPEVKVEVKPEVKPEVKVEVKPEVKPEVKVEDKSEVKPEVKSEEDTTSDSDLTPKEETSNTTVGLSEVASILEDKLTKDLEVLEQAFEAKNPRYKEKEMTPEVKEFLEAQEELRHQKVLEIFQTLCGRYPKSPEVCLTEPQLDKLKDETASNVCLINRKFKMQKHSEVLASLGESHEKDWSGLPKPRSCEVLLKKDHDSLEKEQTTDVQVVEENEDEKSPRNYIADTCKWVSDLPRKIVNGPSCGPKGRSRICTGYVVCDQKEGGGKFIRMSSCRAERCGPSDADAVRCTKDQGYFSERPAGEEKLFLTPRLKKILSSGATEQ